MSAVLPRSTSRQTSAGWLDDSRRSPTAIHHVLDGLAGFHDTEVEALNTVQQLAGRHGVQAGQLVLLGPRDASWLRFVLRAGQWNRRPPGNGGTRVRSLAKGMLLTAAACALLAAALLQQDEFLTFPLELLAIGAAALFGASAAAGLVGLLHRQQPQFRDFDRAIRHQLTQGCWVVLVHDLPWPRQAGVVELINQSSTGWFAVSSARQARQAFKPDSNARAGPRA